MRWIHNFSSSSSSSSSSTSSSLSIHKTSTSSMTTDETFSSVRRAHGSRFSRKNPRSLRIGGGYDFGDRPKISREKNWRHLTDQDLPGHQKQVAPPDHRVDPGALSRSTSASVAVPLPLPLPVPSGDGDSRFPSPKERIRDGFRERDRDRDRGRIGEGLYSSNTPISR